MTETMHDLLTVGQVAETYGVTVRTLHHYDDVGLLSPRERTHAGYRLYTASDLSGWRRLSSIAASGSGSTRSPNSFPERAIWSTTCGVNAQRSAPA